VTPRHEPIGESQAVSENGPLVQATVAVRILQQRDDPGGRLVGTRSGGVAAILRYKKPAAFIPGDGDWTTDERFGRD
jgi:hypothetical protein